jgi:hypothetical protein
MHHPIHSFFFFFFFFFCLFILFELLWNNVIHVHSFSFLLKKTEDAPVVGLEQAATTTPIETRLGDDGVQYTLAEFADYYFDAVFPRQPQLSRKPSAPAVDLTTIDQG